LAAKNLLDVGYTHAFYNLRLVALGCGPTQAAKNLLDAGY
jgi:hypothetical protein